MKKIIAGVLFSISILMVNTPPAEADYESGLNYYRHGEYAAAFKEFKSDATAQADFYLSMMYETGDGIPQNRQKSLAMLRSAAEKGLDVAQANLGMLYLTGMGVEADEREGIMWLTRAAEQGLPEALQAMNLLRADAVLATHVKMAEAH